MAYDNQNKTGRLANFKQANENTYSNSNNINTNYDDDDDERQKWSFSKSFGNFLSLLNDGLYRIKNRSKAERLFEDDVESNELKSR